MFRASQAEVREVITQLENAIYSHTQWHKVLTRNLICQLPYDRRDLEKDAYRHCLFGQWY